MLGLLNSYTLTRPCSHSPAFIIEVKVAADTEALCCPTPTHFLLSFGMKHYETRPPPP
jgi:hypothetical protein